MFEKSQSQLQEQQTEENNSVSLTHYTNLARHYWYDYTLSNKVSTRRAEAAFEKGMELYSTITPKNKAHAEFIYVLAHYYLDFQQHTKAKELIDELINTFLEVHDADSDEIINMYLTVVEIHIRQEEFSTALKYCFHALLISERVKGRDDICTAHIYGDMGDLLVGLRNYKEALGYYYKRLKVVENSPEQTPELLSNSLNHVSMCHNYLDEYELALPFSTRSLELDIKLCGALHYVIAEHYSFRAMLFYYLEQYDEAYECCKKAIKVFKDRVRPNYALYARCYRYMGLIDISIRNNFNSAYKHYSKGLKIVKKNLKDKNDEILEFYNVLGALHRYSHNYPKALTFFEDAHKIAIELHGLESKIATEYQEIITQCKEEMNKENNKK